MQSIKLNTGEVLENGQTGWWVGGILSGVEAFQTLTYAMHPDAVGVSPELSEEKKAEALQNGYFVLFEQDGDFRILSDINTFRDYTVDKGDMFSKNRVIRTLFAIANDLYKTLSKYYIGTTHNDVVGRSLVKNEAFSYLTNLQGKKAIQNVLSSDVEVLPGEKIDAVLINVAVQPVDSIEKIYMEIVLT
jgi:hypothetical protein